MKRLIEQTLFLKVNMKNLYIDKSISGVNFTTRHFPISAGRIEYPEARIEYKLGMPVGFFHWAQILFLMIP